MSMWAQKAVLAMVIIIFNSGLTSAMCKPTCSVVNQKERIVKCSGRQLTCIPIVHPQTRELVLENNLLTKIPRNAFSHLPYLEKLILNNNHISTIEPGAFNYLQRLEALYLRHNRLEKVSVGAFAGIPKLKILDLAHNSISHIESGALKPMKALVHLYLSANKLKVISDDNLTGLGNVQLISFLSNNISLISKNAFLGLVRLQTIYLGNNKLQTVPNILQHARSLVSIGLENNPLICDCQLEYLRIWLRARMTSRRILTTSPVRCATPSLLKEEDLRTVTFRLKCIKPNITSTTTSILAKVQNNVMIKCEASGSPMPNILWTLPPRVNPTQVERLSNGHLLINAAQMSHTGEYICSAKNIAGEAQKYFNVDVLCECNSCGKSDQSLPDVVYTDEIVVGQDGDQNVDLCSTNYSMVHVSLAGVFITIAITFVLTFLFTAIFLTYWFKKHNKPVRKHNNLNNTASYSSTGSSLTLASSERRILTLPQAKNEMSFPGIARYYTPPERPRMTADAQSKYKHRKLVASISDNTYSSMYSSLYIGNDEYAFVRNRVIDDYDYDYDYRDLEHVYAGPNEVVKPPGLSSRPTYMNRNDGGRDDGGGCSTGTNDYSCLELAGLNHGRPYKTRNQLNKL
ncbi:leucine-rich repeat-containing protein 24-like [Anneissia japonica]|uniref:leucine-rich repeat-containing protein 24-like n=1 Tax=Anneissia japonica TaxID=1529436 RepID=UPI0014254CDA|nr:leucine-rich repeat-containing protein 24-like [Anneissia japonica]